MLDVVKAARETVAGAILRWDGETHCGSCRGTPVAGKMVHRSYCWVGKLAAAIEEFDRPPAVTESASVCHRTGRLTEEDYDEAIEALQLARQQAGDRLAGTGAVSCAICTDGDHTAETCHHNPLVLARRWAAASRVTPCYHCGFIAYTDEEAREHFGNHDDEVAKCLRTEAEGQIRTKLAKVTFEFFTRRLGEMMHQAEHWADPAHETPLAVHHRLTAADECFQAVVAFDPARLAGGHSEPFKLMEEAMARPPINPPGNYPPSPELHQYRNSRYVVERLDALRKTGVDRG